MTEFPVETRGLSLVRRFEPQYVTDHTHPFFLPKFMRFGMLSALSTDQTRYTSDFYWTKLFPEAPLTHRLYTTKRTFLQSVIAEVAAEKQDGELPANFASRQFSTEKIIAECLRRGYSLTDPASSVVDDAPEGWKLLHLIAHWAASLKMYSKFFLSLLSGILAFDPMSSPETPRLQTFQGQVPRLPRSDIDTLTDNGENILHIYFFRLIVDAYNSKGSERWNSRRGMSPATEEQEDDSDDDFVEYDDAGHPLPSAILSRCVIRLYKAFAFFRPESDYPILAKMMFQKNPKGLSPFLMLMNAKPFALRNEIQGLDVLEKENAEHVIGTLYEMLHKLRRTFPASMPEPTQRSFYITDYNVDEIGAGPWTNQQTDEKSEPSSVMSSAAAAAASSSLTGSSSFLSGATSAAASSADAAGATSAAFNHGHIGQYFETRADLYQRNRAGYGYRDYDRNVLSIIEAYMAPRVVRQWFQ